MATLTAMPERFAAGTTVSYTRDLPDTPPTDGWQLEVFLAGNDTDSVVAAASGSQFVVTFTAAATAALNPGTYQWAERLSKDGVVLEAARGVVVVEPDINAATDGSLVSWAETTLAIVEQAIAGRLPSGMASYQIHGRAVSKIEISDLLRLRSQLKAEVARERSATGVVPMRRFRFTFTGE